MLGKLANGGNNGVSQFSFVRDAVDMFADDFDATGDLNQILAVDVVLDGSSSSLRTYSTDH